MITPFCTLRLRVGPDPLDAWLSRWGCNLGGLGLSALALLALRHYAASQLEFLLGALTSVMTCLLLFLLGALSRKVHLAVWEGKAPWRARGGELLAHGKRPAAPYASGGGSANFTERANRRDLALVGFSRWDWAADSVTRRFPSSPWASDARCLCW